jgi:TPR repeat protein
MEILLLILITGLFYMIGPVILVKLRGKVTRGKAFLFALLNWIIIYAIFMTIYYAIFPGDADTTVNSAPALWLFVSWRYMTVKNVTKNTTSQKNTPNSIDDVERKFSLSLKDCKRKTFARGKIKYAVFIFGSDDNNQQIDDISALIVVNSSSNQYRYFSLEEPFGTSYTLYERIFDKKGKEIKLISYGDVELSNIDSLSLENNTEGTPLIDHINTIIIKKTKPEASWSGDGLICMNQTMQEKLGEIEKTTNQTDDYMGNYYKEIEKIVKEKTQQVNDFNEAVLLFENQNTKPEAIKIFTRLANENNHDRSQNYLASYFFYDKDDKPKAIEWWEKSASQGNEEAIKELKANKSKLSKTNSASKNKELLDGLHKELFTAWNQEAINKGKSVSQETKSKLSRMFRQSFDKCFSCEKTTMGDIPCNYYLMMPSTDMFIGKIRVMIETLNTPKRYLVAEYSNNSSIMLCEWFFENGIEIKHVNYGPIISNSYEEINFTSHFKRKIEEIL